MKKKILSLVLVVAMLASMLVFAPVSGATKAEVVIETTTVEGSVGDTVSVDVVVHYNGLIYGGQFAYEYDATKLQLNGITRPDGASGELSNKASATFGAAVAEGPYDVIVSTYTKSFDATEGVVMATLNFTILEGASGEAVVSVRDIYRDETYPVTRIFNSATDTSYTADIECVAGGVTVLPEGYLNATPSDPAIFDYEDGTLYGFAPGYVPSGTIVLPSDMEETDGTAWLNQPVNSFNLVVPASVTSLPESFVYRPAAGATVHVYILGKDTQVTAGAFAGRKNQGEIYIHAAADSAAAQYACGTNVYFVATDLCTLTVGGTSYFAPANTEIKAPGVATTDDGKVVVGWKSNDGTKTYAPGAAMTLTEDTKLNPVTIDAIQMNTGIQFKMGTTIDKCQMRFTTDMTVADYNTLASLGTVTVGTLITPARYVSKAGGLTFEALDALSAANGGVPTYINVPAGGYFKINQEETVYTFAGSLAGFKNENIDLAYAAAFYATVELADGSSFTVYSAFDLGANRTVNSAITAMTGAAEYGLTTLESQTLRNLIAAN